jgi:hypothetical protein
MTEDQKRNGWVEWGKYVLEELKKIGQHQDALEKKVDNLRLLIEQRAPQDSVNENTRRLQVIENRIERMEERNSVLATELTRQERQMERAQSQNVTWRWLVEKFGAPAVMAIILWLLLEGIPWVQHAVSGGAAP